MTSTRITDCTFKSFRSLLSWLFLNINININKNMAVVPIALSLPDSGLGRGSPNGVECAASSLPPFRGQRSGGWKCWLGEQSPPHAVCAAVSIGLKASGCLWRGFSKGLRHSAWKMQSRPALKYNMWGVLIDRFSSSFFSFLMNCFQIGIPFKRDFFFLTFFFYCCSIWTLHLEHIW